MDEIELRLAALETLMMERLALDPPAVLRALAAQLRSDEAYGEEKVIRAGALQILDDAVRRFDEATFGTMIRKPPE